MDEKEAMGRLAYRAYMTSEYTKQEEFIRWEDLSERDQRAWVASAQAVTERVLELQRIAMEASE